jgi:hypothetical protein
LILSVFRPKSTRRDHQMALDQSALSELLDVLRAGGGIDVVREALGLILQALIGGRCGRRDRCRALRAHRNQHHTTKR